ncbi:hypothetical protein [Pseudoalteromonas mariniglutinosa]|uniref:hypothetical protein n=1 Tax=Pseudoalteromonas mariniglutinosa TaxID=206042 RepID=UPI00384C3F44
MMNEITPRELARLFDSTNQLLRLYYQKPKWPQIYPLLSNLAERYYLFYQAYPKSMQAQLSLYVPRYEYTTNLVVNQCVLISALCHSQHYDRTITEQMISCCLANYLCVQKQSNKLAAKQALDEQDKKHWQLRHQLAVKLLHSAGTMTSPIQHLLARLNKYKQALLSAPKIMIYDGATTLVALANIIAMNITYRTDEQHISLYKAVADIYLRTPNQFAQNSLKALIAHVGNYLPASNITLNDQVLTYLCSDENQRHILVDLNNPEKVRWHRVKATFNSHTKQRVCNDARLLYTVWFSDNLPSLIEPDSQQQRQQTYIDLISQLKVQKEYSFSALNKLLAPYPELVEQLRIAVKPYNKEQQIGKDLRHCLSMVGYNNAPAIIQRVIFDTLVAHITHPLASHFIKRLDNLVKITQALVRNTEQLQFEQITLSLYGYVMYLTAHHSTEISRKTLFEHTRNGHYSAPIATIFGVKNIDQYALKAYLNQLLADNPWTVHLLASEQQKKQTLGDNEKLWVAIKLVALYVFQPKTVFSSWQTQLIDETLVRLNWPSKTEFYAHLQSLAFTDHF